MSEERICPRCGKRMIQQKFYCRQGEAFWGWSCIYCGEVLDQTILENRSNNAKSD